MESEERALQIAPEGCDGNHPKGGCLFERVRDHILAAQREAEARMRERCAEFVDRVCCGGGGDLAESILALPTEYPEEGSP